MTNKKNPKIVIIFVMFYFGFLLVNINGVYGQDTIQSLFEKRYSDWMKYVDTKCFRNMKDSDMIANPYDSEFFERLTDLSIPVLPYMMEKLEEAPWLDVAIKRITKLNFHLKKIEGIRGRWREETLGIVIEQEDSPTNRGFYHDSPRY